MSIRDRIRNYFAPRATMKATICFDIGEPLVCEYKGTCDELLVLTNHIPTTGSMMGGQKVWKVKIEVN